MIALTDALFDVDGRTVEMKFDFYFDSTPVSVTRNDYLTSASLIEEMHAAGATPLGGVTSNQVTITLINEGGIFSPTNPLSPYYGKMKKGLKVDAFIRIVNWDSIEEYEWEPMGEFYVSSWVATITGLIATIVVSDILYSVFGRPQVIMPISRNTTHAALYTNFFTALDIIPEIDSALTSALEYAYSNDENKEFLTDLSNGAQADCYCNHAGVVRVESLFKNRALRATLTDGDQVKGVETGSSDTIDYDGVSVVCNTHQESAQSEVLTITETTIASQSVLDFSNVLLSAQPLIKFISAAITPGDGVKISIPAATTTTMSFRLHNTNDVSKTVDIALHGTTLEIVKTSMTDSGSNLLSVDSAYIQDLTYAQTIKARLQKFVGLDLPTLNVTVRGNPLLHLGDKIRVVSSKYNLDYTGIIVRATYDYDGSLSSVLTLLDASIFEEVTP